MKEIKNLATYEVVERFEEIEIGKFDSALIGVTNFGNFLTIAIADSFTGEVHVKIASDCITSEIKVQIDEFVELYGNN